MVGGTFSASAPTDSVAPARILFSLLLADGVAAGWDFRPPAALEGTHFSLPHADPDSLECRMSAKLSRRITCVFISCSRSVLRVLRPSLKASLR
jgi:hypothetical protein